MALTVKYRLKITGGYMFTACSNTQCFILFKFAKYILFYKNVTPSTPLKNKHLNQDFSNITAVDKMQKTLGYTRDTHYIERTYFTQLINTEHWKWLTCVLYLSINIRKADLLWRAQNHIFVHYFPALGSQHWTVNCFDYDILFKKLNPTLRFNYNIYNFACDGLLTWGFSNCRTTNILQKLMSFS